MKGKDKGEMLRPKTIGNRHRVAIFISCSHYTWKVSSGNQPGRVLGVGNVHPKVSGTANDPTLVKFLKILPIWTISEIFLPPLIILNFWQVIVPKPHVPHHSILSDRQGEKIRDSLILFS